MKKKRSIFTWISLLFSTTVIVFFTLPWLLIFIVGQLEPNPPIPKITYAEFPLRLEYEVNGQRKEAQDIVICEYDGVGWNEGQGKYRKWKQRLASGNEEILLEMIDDSTGIYFSSRTAEYYMDDLKDYVIGGGLFPDALLYQKQGTTNDFTIIGANELLEQYKIKLIKLEDGPPIKNSFIEE